MGHGAAALSWPDSIVALLYFRPFSYLRVMAASGQRLGQELSNMDVAEVRSRVKQIISNVTNIPSSQIADNAAFVDDLNLDSLSLLEIGVDVDFEFKLGVPEERLQQLRTVQDSVDLVMQVMAEKTPVAT
jgi:acyl carrier protein